MMKTLALSGALCGVLWLCGCHAPATVMGAAPQGAAIAVSALASPEKTVTVQGTMIEKCPVAGCWFVLKDKTGAIKVDTKNAGFVVTEVPLNTEMTVSGTLKTTGERRILATGIRY